jgi:hypothetical protein
MITGVVTAIGWKGLISTGVLARWAGGVGLGFAEEWCRRAAEARVEAILPALALSLFVLVVVSLGTKRPRPEAVGSF